ncbi:hypothetical protein Bca101_011191 [Brassica carinata]
MAGTCSSIRPRLIGSCSTVEFSRLITRAGVPFSVRISTRTRSQGGGFTAPVSVSSREEGPSCIFVGPIDSARKETLEALYRQVRLLNSVFFFPGSEECIEETKPIRQSEDAKAHEESKTSPTSLSSSATQLNGKNRGLTVSQCTAKRGNLIQLCNRFDALGSRAVTCH